MGGKYPQSAPLDLFLAALGIKLFGASELGARLPIALAGVGALMAVYWAGTGLFRKRAALLGTLVLGSMTMFVLEARQLTTDVPLMAALALAMAGLGRYAWPASGQRRLSIWCSGVAGLVLGFPGGGALAGVVLPAASLFGAIVVGWSLVPRRPRASTTARPTSRPRASAPTSRRAAVRRPSAAARRARLRPSSSSASRALALLVASMTGIVASKYSALLGGIPRSGAPTHTFETLMRQLGFGMFPWSAVAVFALARPLIRLDGGRRAHQRAPGLRPALPVPLRGPRLRAVDLPPHHLRRGARALPAGDRARDRRLPRRGARGPPSRSPVAGLLMGTGHDDRRARLLSSRPRSSPRSTSSEKVKWPSVVSIGNLILGDRLPRGRSASTPGLAARGRALGKLAARDLAGASDWRRRLERGIVELGRWGLQGAVALAVVFALYLAQGLVPALSTHFSFKPALESYARFAQGRRQDRALSRRGPRHGLLRQREHHRRRRRRTSAD